MDEKTMVEQVSPLTQMSENLSERNVVFEEYMNQLAENLMTKLQPYITIDEVNKLSDRLENGEQVVIITPISATIIKLNSKDEWIPSKDTNEFDEKTRYDGDYKVAKVEKHLHSIIAPLKDPIKFMHTFLNDSNCDNIHIKILKNNEIIAIWINADIYGENIINKYISNIIDVPFLQGIYGILYIEKDEDDEYDYRKCIFNKDYFDKYLEYKNREWKIIDEKIIENNNVIIDYDDNNSLYIFCNVNKLYVVEKYGRKFTALPQLKTEHILLPLFKVLNIFENSTESGEFYINIT